MKKSNFQTVSFAIMLLTIYDTYKSFKNIFNDFQTEGKGEINKIVF